jgi:UDP-N-acetylglucosamine 2-epimerase (non-hydrolysing)
VPLVVHVVGTRPDFMKVAPAMRALAAHRAEQRLVHAGRDEGLAPDASFDGLSLPAPDFRLEVASSTAAEETARVMLAFEQTLSQLPRPDWVLVPGDGNSTLAAALVASKLGLRVAHLEAGLRGRDRGMPEEPNRVASDHLSDLLLTPSADADENLAREGIPAERVVRVGSARIDTLLAALPRARERAVPEQLGLEDGGYAVVTLRRTSSLEEPATLARLLGALRDLARELPVVFPVHPRTRARLASPDLAGALSSLRLEEPFGYVDFLSLLAEARLVLTDSGGLQEESTALGVPCLTLRDHADRPATVTEGTNVVVGADPGRILVAARRALRGEVERRCPELWDGRTGERVARALLERP